MKPIRTVVLALGDTLIMSALLTANALAVEAGEETVTFAGCEDAGLKCNSEGQVKDSD